MNEKINSNIDFVQKSMDEQKPIDWICRNINISRNTLRKAFPNYKGSQGFNVNKTEKFGLVETLTKECERCKIKFNIEVRINTKRFYKKKFCSVSCAKARDKYWKDKATQYTTICWRFHKKECIICGENKIVAVHHYDENHENNNPENLVPLCPTHHQYVHSKYKLEISDKIDKYVCQFKRGN